MKTLKSIARWALLVLQIIILVLALAWEDGLPISTLGHNLLAVGFMVIFFLLVNSWINVNEEYFVNTHHGDVVRYYTFLDQEEVGSASGSAGRAE